MKQNTSNKLLTFRNGQADYSQILFRLHILMGNCNHVDPSKTPFNFELSKTPYFFKLTLQTNLQTCTFISFVVR